MCYRNSFLGLLLFNLLFINPSSAADNDPVGHHSKRATALLRDAISRETVRGAGNVPAYAARLHGYLPRCGLPG
jgi:hypothetical protein